MTQKEIDKFLVNTKVYFNDKSKEIQEKLFSLGYYWLGDGTKVINKGIPFLYIHKDRTITCEYDMCNFTNYEYREISAEEILSIKLTKPAYRPFKTQEECWDEMLKHQPFGWIVYKVTHDLIAIGGINNLQELVLTLYKNAALGMESAFNDYVFADGTPFGIKED